MNVPAFSAAELTKIKGIANYVLPAVTAYDNGLVRGIQLVAELKKVSPVVSVALGGGGSLGQWRVALEIAKATNAGHLNQPFTTAAFAQGQVPAQLVNALFVLDADGSLAATYLNGQPALALHPQVAAKLLRDMQLKSVKLLAVSRVSQTVFAGVVRSLAEAGIGIVEIAGGLDQGNLVPFLRASLDAGVQVIPHIFGAVADFSRRKVDLDKVSEFAAIIANV